MKEHILSFFYKNPGIEVNIRTLAEYLGSSQSTTLRQVNLLVKEQLLIKIEKKHEHIVKLNEEQSIINKRLFNIKQLYDVGLVKYLEEEFEYPASIIVFGSFSFGENGAQSDIDIAIQTKIIKDISLSEFEKKLGFPIQLFFLTEDLSENLKKSIYNGVVLQGRIQ